jgi:uncharacterized protein YndB with AHSA1/START domain
MAKERNTFIEEKLLQMKIFTNIAKILFLRAIKIHLIAGINSNCTKMTKKQSRAQVVLEFPINASPSLIYNYIQSASGLQEWFAHKVVNKSRIDYVFVYDDGQEAKATLDKSINNKLCRFHFEHTPEDEYIEMEIIVDELTEDVAIKVTEFCNDTESEKREIGEVWHTQIQTLKDIIGA